MLVDMKQLLTLAVAFFLLPDLTMPAWAASRQNEVPDTAVDEYLSDDLKQYPDELYIPNPEELEQFKQTPLYKFFDGMMDADEPEGGGSPGGGGCGINKRLFENV